MPNKNGVIEVLPEHRTDRAVRYRIQRHSQRLIIYIMLCHELRQKCRNSPYPTYIKALMSNVASRQVLMWKICGKKSALQDSDFFFLLPSQYSILFRISFSNPKGDGSK